MPSKNTKFYSVILMTADFLVLLIAFTIAYILRVQVDSRPLVSPVFAFDYLIMAATILPLWIIVFASLGLYSAQIYNRRLAEWGRLFIGVVIGILIVIGWEYVTDKTFFPARLVVLYALGISFALVLLERELMRLLRSLAFHYGVGISRVLIIGTGAPPKISLRRWLQPVSRVTKSSPWQHPKVRAVPPGITHYDSVETALSNVKAQRIDTIIQTDFEHGDMNQKILSAAQTNHIRYNFIPGQPEFYTGKNTIDIFWAIL